MFFPKELKDTPEMEECMNELSLISKGGIKSKHDDFIDNISQLGSLTTWRPSEDVPMEQKDMDIYEADDVEEESHGLDSYLA